MVTCERVIELLGGYVAGSLPDPTRVGVSKHLADCFGCAALTAEYREVIRLAGSLPLPALSVTAASRLLQGVRSAAAEFGSGAMDETRPDLPALTPDRGGVGR